MFNFYLSFFLLSFFFEVNASEVRPDQSNITKAVLLTKIKDAQTAQLEKVSAVQQTVNQRLNDLQSISIESESVKSPIRQMAEELESLQKLKREYLLRRDFLDELMLQVSTRWNNQPLKPFCESALMTIAENHLNSMGRTDENLAVHQPIWRFSAYLSAALRASPLAAKDVFPFILNYMEFSGVLEPFFLKKDYSNGLMSIGAAPQKASEPDNVLQLKLRKAKIESNLENN